MKPATDQNNAFASFSYPTVSDPQTSNLANPVAANPQSTVDDSNAQAQPASNPQQQTPTVSFDTPASQSDSNFPQDTVNTAVVDESMVNPSPAASPMGESTVLPDTPPTVSVPSKENRSLDSVNAASTTTNTPDTTSVQTDSDDFAEVDTKKKRSGTGALQALAKKLSGLKDDLVAVEPKVENDVNDFQTVGNEVAQSVEALDQEMVAASSMNNEDVPMIDKVEGDDSSTVVDDNSVQHTDSQAAVDIQVAPEFEVSTDPQVDITHATVEASSPTAEVTDLVSNSTDNSLNVPSKLALDQNTNVESPDSSVIEVPTPTYEVENISGAPAQSDLNTPSISTLDTTLSNSTFTQELKQEVVTPIISEPQFIQQDQSMQGEQNTGPSVADLASMDEGQPAKQSLGRYPYTIEQLLDLVIERDASDLHITVGYPVMIRVDGDLITVSEEIVEPHHAVDLILPVLPEQKKELLEVNREVDLAYSHQGNARFRINAYYQQQTLAGAFRLIPNKIRSLDELNLPQIYHQLSKLKQGLVLVTGPTGSGKSTTLAAILHEVNLTRPDHIITIEDPIEYLLPKARAMVDQRELHEDTHSWEIAMKSALRQDPDVILVGEMRDYETISSAITLAETGHLVFATLHTNSASQTLDRIIDVFPEHQQSQVRAQLSNTIEAVVAQRLMPIIGGGRRAVSEIMIATPAIRNLIREAKSHQIDNVIRTSADIGMISLEHSLVKLVRENVITMESAQEYAVHPEEVVRLLKS